MNRFWRGLDLIIGAIFIYAGTLKAMQPLGFANDIENYHLVPWALGVRFAFYLPWLEIFCGIALILRRLYGGALAILMRSLSFFRCHHFGPSARIDTLAGVSAARAKPNLTSHRLDLPFPPRSFSWRQTKLIAIQWQGREPW